MTAPESSSSARPAGAGRSRDVGGERDTRRCLRCDGSGIRPDGSDCRCPARPFREEPAAVSPSAGDSRVRRHQPPGDRPAVSRPEWEREQVSILADGHELTARIDDLLAWSRDTLGPLVAVGELTGYLAAGGQPEVIADDVLRRLDEVGEALDVLPHILAGLRRAAALLSCPECEPEAA